MFLDPLFEELLEDERKICFNIFQVVPQKVFMGAIFQGALEYTLSFSCF
jgi:hypothetical protein